MQNKNAVENLTMHLAVLPEPVLLIEPGEQCQRELLIAGKNFISAKSDYPTHTVDDTCKSIVLMCMGLPSPAVLSAISEGHSDGTPLLLVVEEDGDPGQLKQTEVIARLFECGFRLTALPGQSGHLKRASSQVAAQTADSQLDSTMIYKAVTQSIRFRSYREGDEIQILELFESVFGVRRSLAHWNWKYRDNPWGKGQISLLESASGQLAGHFAVYSLPMHVDEGRSFTTIHGGDVMTSPHVRRIGVGPTSVLTQMTTHLYNRFLCGNYSWGFGFNTGRARVMGKRYVGYTYLPEVVVRSLAIAGFLANTTPTPAYQVRRIHQLSPAFDQLFERVSGDYQLLVERKARYLDWRYLSCPDKQYLLYGVFRGEQLCGWGVFIRTGRGLFWGDALFQRDDAEMGTTALLKQLVDDHGLVKGTINAWFSPVPEWWVSILDQMGFVHRKEPDALAPMIMRFDTGFSLEEIEQKFYYTKGDSDLF